MSKRGSKLARPPSRVAVRIASLPFKDLRHPPIQLGILQQCLERAGIAAQSHSLELAFMDHLYAKTVGSEALTVADYQRVATKQFVFHLGDWIFKVPPYAEGSSDDEEYLAYIHSQGISEETIVIARRMRTLVPEFLDAVADELLVGTPRVVG